MVCAPPGRPTTHACGCELASTFPNPGEVLFLLQKVPRRVVGERGLVDRKGRNRLGVVFWVQFDRKAKSAEECFHALVGRGHLCGDEKALAIIGMVFSDPPEERAEQFFADMFRLVGITDNERQLSLVHLCPGEPGDSEEVLVVECHESKGVVLVDRTLALEAFALDSRAERDHRGKTLSDGLRREFFVELFESGKVSERDLPIGDESPCAVRCDPGGAV